MLKKFIAIFIAFNFFLININSIIKADDLPENISYINDFTDLKNLATTVNGGNNCNGKYFLLTSNIDMNNELWTPIGNKKANSFLGTFDGNGFEISNLRIESPSLNLQGLFGYNSGLIKNVKVSGRITSNNDSGGIAGRNLGTIENCQSNIKINASSNSSNIGGIVGYNKGGIIQNCQNFAEITGWQVIGGIVGCNDLNDSNNSNGIVQNCYNLGAVSGDDKCGGCVGINKSEIKNSYSIASVNCNGNDNGAFVGCNESLIQNCYYQNNENMSDISATSKTFEEFKSGEVAWLLRNGEDSPWGQELNNQQTPYPILDKSKNVYKIIFKDGNTEIKTCYSNSENNIIFPDINDLTFVGWIDDNNTEFTKDTPITKDIILYVLRKNFFTITFNANGGKCNIEFAQTNSENKLNSLPGAKFNRHKFLGWYTEKNGGKKITMETIFDKDITVYAKWIRKSQDTNDILDLIEKDDEPNLNEKDDENNKDENNEIEEIEEADKTISELPCKICNPETVAVINIDGARKIIYRSVAKNGKIYIPPNDPTKIEIINNKKNFIDVPQNHWAYNAITFVSAHELFDDNLPNIFEPSKPINFKILIGILEKLIDKKNFYTELTSIFNYDNQQFFLNYNVTREQLIFIIYKYFGSAQNFDDKLNFSDINQVNFYALNSLHWAVKNNIVNSAANLFYPKNFATKAETAKIFHNLMLNLFYKES